MLLLASVLSSTLAGMESARGYHLQIVWQITLSQRPKLALNLACHSRVGAELPKLRREKHSAASSIRGRDLRAKKAKRQE